MGRESSARLGALDPVRANLQLERRTQRNWLLLGVASIVSTAGLAVAVSPMLSSEAVAFWPWAHTTQALLGGLSLALTALVWYLTDHQRQLAVLRLHLHTMQAQQLARTKEWAATLEATNAKLNQEIEERKRVEAEIRLLNESLEAQVAQRTAVIQRQADELGSAKKALELQNQRLRELYRTAHQVVDNVSHEFRTPLTVIREYAATLLEGLMGPTTAEQARCLDTIINRVNDLIVMVNDLLDISRIEGDILMTSRRATRPSEIVENVAGILQRKADASNVRLLVRPFDALPKVYCDREKVGRVLINLGVNAIKFSNPGSEVVVWGRLTPDEQQVEFGVTDQGPGIAPEHLEIIFERFKQLGNAVRSSTKGFGLGLSIVKELVQLHFGIVRVESTVGKGTTFTFTLPLADPARLFPVYFDKVRTLREPVGEISLVRVCLAAGADASLSDEVTYFIESHTRRVDLVFPLGSGQWLLVAATGTGDAEQMVQRLEAARLDASGKSGFPVLPALEWRIEGTWNIATASEAFVHHFAGCHAFGQEERPPRLPAAPAPDAIKAAT
jgi:hypothetical protein